MVSRSSRSRTLSRIDVGVLMQINIERDDLLDLLALFMELGQAVNEC